MAIFVLMLNLTAHAFGQSNRSSSGLSNGSTTCVTDAKWANANANFAYSRLSNIPVSMTLLTYVSKGSVCTNTDIRITATFLNEANESICSGIVPLAITSASEVQIFNIEIRPLTQNDFLRWRNEPGKRGLQQGKPLRCLNADDTSDINDMERAKATSVHLTVVVLPPHAGLAVLEALIRLDP
jgi:hypothetical protein